MSAEDLEKYETEMELSLYREYKDIVGQFSYVVETERRFYLANSVEMVPRNTDGEVYFELRLTDAWVWDMYRPARFVKQVRVITFRTSTSKRSRSRNCAFRSDPRCPAVDERGAGDNSGVSPEAGWFVSAGAPTLGP